MKTKLFFTALLICASSACTMDELENSNKIDHEYINAEISTDTVSGRTGQIVTPKD